MDRTNRSIKESWATMLWWQRILFVIFFFLVYPAVYSMVRRAEKEDVKKAS